MSFALRVRVPISDPPLGGWEKAVARFALLPPPGLPPRASGAPGQEVCHLLDLQG